jgi:4-aminobutyrate aminotransferase
VACAAGKVTLALLEKELLDNARQRGEELIEGLNKLAAVYPCLSSPRGKGLMIGIDVLDSRGNLSPNFRDHLLNEAFYSGLLLLGCGKAAIRFCPPLVITSEQIEAGLAILGEILATLP